MQYLHDLSIIFLTGAIGFSLVLFIDLVFKIVYGLPKSQGYGLRLVRKFNNDLD